MDEARALSIVSALANGVNPHSGEVFAEGSPYQSAEIVRALFVAVRALQGQMSPRRRADAPTNAGKPWTEKEDVELQSAFDRGVTIADLARVHGRTAVGIQARLEKHGRVPPRQDNRPSQRAQPTVPSRVSEMPKR